MITKAAAAVLPGTRNCMFILQGLEFKLEGIRFRVPRDSGTGALGSSLTVEAQLRS